ncbi:hypothetical protein C1H76_0277 [Elsinoe australis]|uniref:Uncharacterized protein n=1 Tax=Elsinoe australis TaxID=40998 RepID=A0A4U7BC98_9PEZI|nr:hypothetical protein C1H76_0277 [Elsinoe australis]
MDRDDDRNMSKRLRSDSSQDGPRKALRPDAANGGPFTPISLDDAQKDQIQQFVYDLGQFAIANVDSRKAEQEFTKLNQEAMKMKDYARSFPAYKERLEVPAQKWKTEKKRSNEHVEAMTSKLNNNFLDICTTLLNSLPQQRANPVVQRRSPSIEEFEALQQRLNKLESQSAIDDGRVAKIESRLSQFQQDQTNHGQDMRRSIRENADKVSRLEDKSSQLQEGQKQLSSLSGRIDAMTGELSTNIGDHEKLKEQQSIIENQKSEIESLKKAVSANKEQIQALNQTLQQVSVKSHEHQASVKAKIDQLEKINANQKPTNALHDTLAGVKKDIHLLKTEQSSIEARVQKALDVRLRTLSAQDDFPVSKTLIEELSASTKAQIETQLAEEQTSVGARFAAQQSQLDAELQRIRTKASEFLHAASSRGLDELRQTVGELNEKYNSLEQKHDVYTRSLRELRVSLKYANPQAQQQAAQQQSTQQRPARARSQSGQMSGQSPVHSPSAHQQPQIPQQPSQIPASGPATNPFLYYQGPQALTQFQGRNTSEQLATQLQMREQHLQQLMQASSMNQITSMLPPSSHIQAQHPTTLRSQNMSPTYVQQNGPFPGSPVNASVAAPQVSSEGMLQSIKEIVAKDLQDALAPQIEGLREKADHALSKAVEAYTLAQQQSGGTTPIPNDVVRDLKNDIDRKMDRVEGHVTQQSLLITGIMNTANEASSRANRATDKYDDLDKRFNTFERSGTSNFLMGDGTPRIATPTAASPSPPELFAVRTDISRLTKDYQTLQAQVQAQAGAIDTINTFSSSTKAELANLNTKTEKVAHHLDETSALAKALSKDYLDLEPIVRANDRELTALSSIKLVQLSNEAQSNTARLTILTTELASHTSEIQSHTKAIQSHTTQLSQLHPLTLEDVRKTLHEHSVQLEDLAEMNLPQLKFEFPKVEKAVGKNRTAMLGAHGVLRGAVKRLEDKVGLERTDFAVEDRAAIRRLREEGRERGGDTSN